ncbi:PEP-utilizing protein [Mycobacterium lentiflavum]|uniref:PEP-utilizing protein n=1 Tax=Mycobacterium lentiflavum TaxID=141349 RepID=A0A0E4GZ31_MYCLN|nr:PEP-utilizing enzyme [Mycobacterium lentiflavum]CQD17553.1 PEP-utilizing protein [Mycobacterium lentiflavum]
MAVTNSPVHDRSGAQTPWSRVNFSEAIQGVQTPLSWTFWQFAMETAVRRGFGALGVLTRAEVPPPASPDDRISAVFYGLPAGNLNTFHRIGQRMPGTDGDTVVQQMFGEPRGTVGVRQSVTTRIRARLRYPVILASTVSSAYRHRKRIRPARESIRSWWRRNTVDSPPTTLAGAQWLLREAAEKFVDIGTMHTTLSLVGQALGEQVELLALAGFGSRERAADLMTGYGSVDETEVIADLWNLADGALPMTEFVARHGYHGPSEGNLPSRVWREDQTPLWLLANRYRCRDAAHPDQLWQRQQRVRRNAEREILANLNAVNKIRAQAVLWLAAEYIPIREVGKAGFLHCVDGARCAARIIGNHLADAGHLADPEDVFFLTYDELVGGATAGEPDALRELVLARKADHEQFQRLDVPDRWIGNPTPTEALPAVEDDRPGIGELTGIGVCGGEVTGTARVIFDPDHADLDDGDILVCPTTDPSWTPLFMLADALVIDTGGVMSHGAIVARELGVTCVINSKRGTRDIPEGAQITVDGTTGRVIIHKPLATSERNGG